MCMSIAVKIKSTKVNEKNIAKIVGPKIRFEIFKGKNDANIILKCDQAIKPLILGVLQNHFGSNNVFPINC